MTQRVVAMAGSTLAALCVMAAVHARQAEIVQYPLPAAVTHPEGIAHDAKNGTVYVGSAVSGAIARLPADASSKEAGTVISPEGAVVPTGPFPGLLGMDVDQAGRLWVAGGRTGTMAVVDSSGKVLKRFDTPAEPGGLINDVVVVGSNAYFTDTSRPTLWRVSVEGSTIGDVEPWLEFEGSPIEYARGSNLNGIAATADGRHLIVVHMGKGLLYRIGVADKSIAAIDTGGEALNTADGLVLDGRTLYVVRQGEQEVVTLELSPDLSSARVVNRFKDPALLFPATAAKVGDRLLVVNTQFNKRRTKDPVTPFSVVGIPLSRLAGK